MPFHEHSLRFWAQKRDPTLRDVQQNLDTDMEVIEVRYQPRQLMLRQAALLLPTAPVYTLRCVGRSGMQCIIMLQER